MNERMGKIEDKEDSLYTLQGLARFSESIQKSRDGEKMPIQKVKTIYKDYGQLFTKTGITFEDVGDQSYKIRIAYMSRFLQVLSKGPSDIKLEQEKKEDLMFCVEESFNGIAEELYLNKNMELVDKFIHDQLKDFPTKIHKELDRVLGVGWTDVYDSGIFMKNYADAYKKGYLVELSGMCVNGLLKRVVLPGKHHEIAKDFYKQKFYFKETHKEIRDAQKLRDILIEEEKRYADCILVLSSVPKEHLQEQVFRDSFNNFINILGISVESISFIESKNLAMDFADKLVKKIDELELMISKGSKGDEFYTGLQEDLTNFRQKVNELIKSKTGTTRY